MCNNPINLDDKYAVKGPMFILIKYRDKSGELRELRLRNDLAAFWKTIGTTFGFKAAVLERIDRDGHDTEEKFSKVIQLWMQGSFELYRKFPPTWNSFLSVLKEADFENLADILRLALACPLNGH